MTAQDLTILVLIVVCAGLCLLALWQDYRIEQLQGYVRRIKEIEND